MLLLLVVSFLPFPTRLVADAVAGGEGARVFTTMYGMTLLAIRVTGFALDEYARREQLYTDEPDAEPSPSKRRRLLVIVAAYVAAILVGLVAPGVAVGLYCALAVWLIVPFKEIGRLLFRE